MQMTLVWNGYTSGAYHLRRIAVQGMPIRYIAYWGLQALTGQTTLGKAKRACEEHAQDSTKEEKDNGKQSCIQS